MEPKIVVVYYSSTGHVRRLAEAVAKGAEEAGAEVRLRRVQELAPEEAIKSNEQWWANHQDELGKVEVVTHADLEWADGYAFGTPTRFGNVSAQLKQFIDSCGGLWFHGKLADKPVTSFTSAMNRHGGQESTITSMNNIFYHWGSVIVPPGYTDQMIFASGGNPYGASAFDTLTGEDLDAVLKSAAYQGRRLAKFASAILASRQPA
jgi:NAD(P)H dehydrogenase (quinone)